MTPFEKQKTVLVVDTHEISRNHLLHILESIGCRAMPAGGGIDAIEMLRMHRTDPFDLIITEVNMITVDGVEVVEFSRHLKMETPIIFMSENSICPGGYRRSQLREFSPHFLQKPLTDVPTIHMMVTAALHQETATHGSN